MLDKQYLKEEKAVNILERIYNSVSEAASQLKETKSVLTSEIGRAHV